MKQKKIRPKHSVISNIKFLVKDIWKLNKKLFLLLFIEGVFCSIVPFLGIYLPKIALELVNQKVTIQEAVSTLGGFILMLTLVMSIGNTARGAKYMHYNGLRMNYMRELFYKTLSCQYNCIESAQGQTNYRKAMRSAEGGDWSGVSLMITSLMSLIASLISFILYSAVIAVLNPWILLLLVGMSGVNYFALQYARKYEHQHKQELATYEKKLNYIENTASNVKYGKDMRLYTMTGWFVDMREHLLQGYTQLNEQIQNRHFLSAVVNASTLFLRDGIAYIYLIGCAYTGSISIADFVLFFGAITGFSAWVSQIVEHTNIMIGANLQLNDMREFLECEEEEVSQTEIFNTHGPVEIEFRHVYFAYNKEEKNILEDFNLTIRAGEKIALVGINGAGKTTIIKLLCGMYEPQAGEILINGVDSRKIGKKELYKLFSAVFQDVLILPFTLAENICMDIRNNVNEKRVWESLKQVGLEHMIKKQPDTIWTKMTRIFDEQGLVLSGGQEQKLLMARALYKGAPILILDEPTAALDPIAESEVYEKFHTFSQEKTAIYISHRLASTRFCDIIYVIKDGKVIQSGAHEVLMEQEGEYREMFDIQSHYYNDNEEGKLQYA